MAFTDRTVGLYAANAILAALYRKERTGRGMAIEVPMFETMAFGVLVEHLSGLSFEPPEGPAGYARSLTKERRPFVTADGYVCAVIYNDAQWRAFLRVVGDESRMDTDPRFRDLSARTVHAQAVYAMIGEEMRKRTTAEWLDLLGAADVPAAPMHTLESLARDPHLEATGFFSTVEHPTEGTIREMAIPGHWSEDGPRIRRHAPRLGEHSVEVLREAGLTREQIDGMLATRATTQAG
jgi:crotonobetainyl-CoA:carnitine CoA-transferase CaiB-like acyl-CoA transferase